jgi:hypothetical protein
VLYAIYAIAIYKTLKKRKDGIRPVDILLLYTSIPLILGFTILSLFRSALPHWTGPAFITLLILSSEYLADNYSKRRTTINWSLSFAIGMFIFVLVSGFIQINYGVIEIKSESASFRLGKNDFSLDMYGWKQAGENFKVFLAKEGISENDLRHLALITDKWFPAAHIDYYMAYPLKIKLIAFGGVERIHKYYWINKRRKLSRTDRIFYITDSRNYNGPEEFAGCFNEIIPLDTLIIDRNHKPVKYIYIYDMVDLKCDTILNSPHPGF